MNIRILSGDYDGDELIAHPIVKETIVLRKKDIKELRDRLRAEIQKPSTLKFRLDGDYPIFKFMEKPYDKVEQVVRRPQTGANSGHRVPNERSQGQGSAEEQ